MRPLHGHPMKNPAAMSSVIIPKSADFASAMWELSSDAMFSSNDSAQVSSWNPAAVAKLGYRAEDIIGQPWTSVLADNGTAIHEAIARCSQVRGVEALLRSKAGAAVPATLALSPIAGKGGTSAGFLAIFQIATSAAQSPSADAAAATQSSQYARSLIEASLDPLVTISPDGKITDVNEATIKITGVPREKLIGTDFSDYFTEPEKAREGYQQVFAKGFVTDYPLTIRHRDGHLTDVLYNASVYRDAKRQRARRVRRRARRHRAEAGLAVRAQPDRSLPRPARHHQPRGQDHRRQRGARSRSPACCARSSSAPTSPTTSPSPRRRARATSRSSPRASSPTTRSPSATRDGRLTDVLYNASVYNDARGKVLGVFAAARDVTAQKQASQYARSLIEASLDPLVTISPEGKITDVNEARSRSRAWPARS